MSVLLHMSGLRDVLLPLSNFGCRSSSCCTNSVLSERSRLCEAIEGSGLSTTISLLSMTAEEVEGVGKWMKQDKLQRSNGRKIKNAVRPCAAACNGVPESEGDSKAQAHEDLKVRLLRQSRQRRGAVASLASRSFTKGGGTSVP